MKYAAVFFDLDGTVADTLQNITNAINHTLRRFGRKGFAPETVKPHLGYGVDYLLGTLLPDISETELDEIIRYYRPYYAQHTADNVVPYDGILSMMQQLKRDGLRLAIISNKPDAAVQPIVEDLFRNYVSFSVGELPEIARKPAPDMLIHAAEQMHIPLSSCVYVGDTEVDIQTAANAGIDCITVTWGFRTREALVEAGANRFADTPEELIRLIEV